MENTNVLMFTISDEELPKFPSMAEDLLKTIPPRKEGQDVRYGFRFDTENEIINSIGAIKDGMEILDVIEAAVQSKENSPACECSCTDCNSRVADMVAVTAEPDLVGCPIPNPEILGEYLPTVDSLMNKLVPSIKETIPEQHQRGFFMGYMTGVIDTVGYLSATNKLK